MLAAVEQQHGFYTYFLLRAGADVAAVERRVRRFLGAAFSAAERRAQWSGIDVMPCATSICTRTRDDEWKPPGSAHAVSTFAAIAVLILLIACINFMNLADGARGEARARGRRPQGRSAPARAQLVAQFLGESIGMALLAMLRRARRSSSLRCRCSTRSWAWI